MQEMNRMKERDRHILKQFASAVRKEFPEAEIWCFGSRVNGNASEYSDMDVCVVVENYDESVDKKIMTASWEIGFENDVVISTVTYSKNDFRYGAISSSPFIRSILSSGIAA